MSEQMEAIRRIAEIAQMRAGIRQTDQAAGLLHELLDFVFVGIHQAGGKDRLQTLIRGEIEKGIDGILALAFGDLLDVQPFQTLVLRPRRHGDLNIRPIAKEQFAFLRHVQIVAEAAAEFCVADLTLKTFIADIDQRSP